MTNNFNEPYHVRHYYNAISKEWLGYELTEEQYNKIYNEQFKNIRRMYDWRNYVPKTMQTEWHVLNFEAKIITYIMAEGRASSEEYE